MHRLSGQPALRPRSILRSSLTIGSLSALTMLLGFAVQAVLAAVLGAGQGMDVFFVALALPAMIANVSLSALSLSLVPVFKEAMARETPGAAWRLASGLMIRLTPLCLGLGGLLLLAAEPVVRLLAPGFDARSVSSAAGMLRVMSLGAVLDVYRAILSTFYYSQDRFFLPQFAPVLNHAAMIASALTLMSWLGLQGLAVGWVVGSLLMILFLGFGLLGQPALRMRGRQDRLVSGPTAKMIWPSLVLVLVGAVIPVVDRAFATTLSQGAVSYLGYGYKVLEIMLRTAPMAIVLAAFPRMSGHASTGDWAALDREVKSALSWMLLASIPVALMVLLLREPMVSALFERGAFDRTASHGVANVVGWYALAFLPASVLFLINHVFFALRRPKILILLGGGSIALTALLDYSLSRIWGTVGIAATYVAVAALYAAGAAWILARSPNPVRILPGARWLGKVILAAMGLVAAVEGTGAALSRWPLGGHSDEIAVVCSAFLGSLSYAVILWLTGVPEFKALRERAAYGFDVLRGQVQAR